MTYAESGSRPVVTVGLDEKRAIAVMVSLLNDGTLLPFQAIYLPGQDSGVSTIEEMSYY